MNAGTNTTPPLSATLAASGPVSAAFSMMPIPSRSHWIAAPVTKIAPSITNATSPPAEIPRHAGQQPLDRRRVCGTKVHEHERAGAVRVLGHARSRSKPGRTMPIADHRRCRSQARRARRRVGGPSSRSARCWAGPRADTSAARRTPRTARRTSCRASMSYRSVRLAFDGSVACTPPSGPPVRRQRIQLSTVPNARSGPPSTPPWVSSHSSLVAEK